MIGYEEIRVRVRNLTDTMLQSRATDKYPYAAGYLSSLLTITLQELPEDKCRAMLDMFDRVLVEHP